MGPDNFPTISGGTYRALRYQLTVQTAHACYARP